MSKFEIEDKAVKALWERLAGNLQPLAPSRDAAELFLEKAGRYFLRKFRENPLDAFECVSFPAGRAGKHTIGLRISRAFKGILALAAKRSFDVTAH
jgi:hypothetical protein